MTDKNTVSILRKSYRCPLDIFAERW